MENSKIARLTAYHIVVSIGAILVIAPFIWMVSSAFKHPWEIIRIPPTIIPEDPTLENFVRIWTIAPFARFFLNSLFVTGLSTIIVLFTSSLVGYVLGKIPFPGSRLILLVILMGLMVPFEVFMIPLYILMGQLRLLNSLWALIVPFSISPSGIFLFRQHMYSIPTDLMDAAEIDGANQFRIYWTVILPLCKPILAAFLILKFFWTWESFLWPLIVLEDESLFTIPLGLIFFSTEYWSRYELVMAASVVSALPIIVMYIVGQKYFVQGIALSGVK